MPDPSSPAPFEVAYSPALPSLLGKLGCSIAVSTYQAGRVVVISATDDGQLVQLPRAFARPMALAVSGGRLAVSTASAVEVFAAEPRLAASHPRRPGVYDTLYVPRTTHRTGRIDAHGVGWSADGALWVVNTRFDCLATLEDGASFAPRWTPPFVAEAAPGDRCHLNGVVFVDGQPRYATCLGRSSEPDGWRDTMGEGGLLLDVAAGKVVAEGLAMPHSPCVVGGELYVLLAATGELARVDLKSGRCKPVVSVGGFARGLAHHAGYLFVGFSKLRVGSALFGAAPVAAEATHAGVAIIDAARGEVVARMTWQSSVEEVFDVAVLPDRRPGLIGPRQTDRATAITTPSGAWWLPSGAAEVPASPWPHLDPEGDFDRGGPGSWYTEYAAAAAGGVDLEASRYFEGYAPARDVGHERGAARRGTKGGYPPNESYAPSLAKASYGPTEYIQARASRAKGPDEGPPRKS
jgi:uncharacterized protein (TIGR03032 family)